MRHAVHDFVFFLIAPRLGPFSVLTALNVAWIASAIARGAHPPTVAVSAFFFAVSAARDLYYNR